MSNTRFFPARQSLEINYEAASCKLSADITGVTDRKVYGRIVIDLFDHCGDHLAHHGYFTSMKTEMRFEEEKPTIYGLQGRMAADLLNSFWFTMEQTEALRQIADHWTSKSEPEVAG